MVEQEFPSRNNFDFHFLTLYYFFIAVSHNYIAAARQTRLHFYQCLCFPVKSTFGVIHLVTYLNGRLCPWNVEIHFHAVIIEIDGVF